LAYNNTLNSDRVVKWGGAAAVVAAMNQHPDDLRVQVRHFFIFVL
jgi:hypothetical protein